MNVRSLAVSLLSLAVSLPVLAQSSPAVGEVTLFGEEQLKVESATKTEIPISRAPGAVTVITAKQIQESGMRTVPDLLRLVSGLHVRWNPMTETLDIRGFGENPFSSRVLILIDGAPLNSGDTGGFPLSPAFDLFPVQAIKRIEVVRGPGSALYGENAFWGVVNIITLSGEDLEGGNAQLFAGDRSTTSLNAMYGKKLANGSFLASIRAERSIMPVLLWMEDESKYRSTELFLKASYKDVQLSAYRHADRMDGFREEIPPEFGLPPGAAFESAHKLEQAMNFLAFRFNHAPQDAKVTYSADVSWSHRNGMHCAGCHAAPEKPEFSEAESHGYQAIGDFRLGLKMIPGHDILLGAEARRLDRGAHKHELSEEGVIASGYDKYAVYAQDQFDILADRLRAVAGVRYDGKTDLFDSTVSPRFSLVFTPTPGLVVRGGFGTAFRFPTFSELYQESWFINIASDQGLFPPFPLAVFAPNPDLQPEEIRTIDAGAEYQLSPTVSVKADLFRSTVKDFIVLTQHEGALASLQFENHPDDATITGQELEVRANVTGRFTGFANWTHQTEQRKGRGVDSTGLPMEFPYAPKNKINLGGYAGPFGPVRAAMELSWRSSYVGPASWYPIRSNFTDFSVHPLPSYALLNARISYDLPSRLPVRLTLFGNNLFDKEAEETILGSPTAIAGREFFGQVEVRF
jgi:iron complex outermembrane receptor protein